MSFVQLLLFLLIFFKKSICSGRRKNEHFLHFSDKRKFALEAKDTKRYTELKEQEASLRQKLLFNRIFFKKEDLPVDTVLFTMSKALLVLTHQCSTFYHWQNPFHIDIYLTAVETQRILGVFKDARWEFMQGTAWFVGHHNSMAQSAPKIFLLLCTLQVKINNARKLLYRKTGPLIEETLICFKGTPEFSRMQFIPSS